jgi:hypothetical protein
VRIYLKNSKELLLADDRVVVRYHAPAFYEVDQEIGEAWIASGDADPATEDNVALPLPPEPKPEVPVVETYIGPAPSTAHAPERPPKKEHVIGGEE